MQSPILTKLSKPTKSVYKGVVGHSTHIWTYHDELTNERLLSLLSIILLPIAIGLLGSAISDQNLFSSSGDGVAIASGSLGYSQICFTGVNSDGTVNPEQCSTISTGCAISFSAAAQAFQQQHYGIADTQLNNCTEFNGYRATHVMAIIFAGIAFLAMALAHARLLPLQYNSKVKIFAFVTAFLAGSCGVIAQCVVLDWWNFNMQSLVTLGFSGFVSTGTNPLYVLPAQAFFNLVGGWVAALSSALIYILHFPSAMSK